MKINQWTIFGSLLFGILITPPALAFVHGQMLFGSRQGDFEGGDGVSGPYKSSEVHLSVGFDYFKDKPVTVGAFVDTRNFRLRETESKINRLDYWSIGPEVTAWYPRFQFKPYAKGGVGFGSYTAMEAGKGSNYTSRAWYSAFSRRVSVGLKWDQEPLFTPLVEYQMSSEELELEESTSDLDPKSSILFKSNVFLIGFESSI
jgi:hypothetical protein